jgi:hypothetical protein
LGASFDVFSLAQAALTENLPTICLQFWLSDWRPIPGVFAALVLHPREMPLLVWMLSLFGH